jgi:hypothetical protein
MKHCPKCGVKHNDSVIVCDCGYELVPRGGLVKREGLRKIGIGAALMLVFAVMLFIDIISSGGQIPIPGFLLFGTFIFGIANFASGCVSYFRPIKVVRSNGPSPHLLTHDPGRSGGTTSGVVPAWGPNRTWFSMGAVLGGLALGVAMMQDETLHLSALVALAGGLLSAGAFLACFDRSGDWNWSLAIPAVGVAVIISLILKVPVAGGVIGFIGYMIIGYVAVGLRLLWVLVKRKLKGTEPA